MFSHFCLEYLAKEGGLAVLEEPLPERSYGDTVLLMLADDFLGAVQRIAAYLGADPPDPAAEQIESAVLLLWNKDYRSTPAIPLEGTSE